MKLLPGGSFDQVPALFQPHFDDVVLKQIWQAIEPRHYARVIMPWILVKVVLAAFLSRLSGLRSIVACHGEPLGTQNIGTLSVALAHSKIRVFMERVRCWLESREDWTNLGPEEMVAADTTWITLPCTQRHKDLRKTGNHSVGLGAMFALRLRGGLFPLRLVALSNGAHNDGEVARHTSLVPGGPTYLFDRGFYSLKTIAQWLAQRVHFIQRAKPVQFCYDTLQNLCTRSIFHGNLRIIEDAIVLLGAPKTRAPRSRVRLVRAIRVTDNEEIILLSGHMDRSAKWILDAYKQRWQIEDIFNFIKEQLGMAHLYGFSANAIETLLGIAMLGIGLLLHAGEQSAINSKTVARRLNRLLSRLRKLLGILPAWKPNTTRRGVKQRKHTPKPNPISPWLTA